MLIEVKKKIEMHEHLNYENELEKLKIENQ